MTVAHVFRPESVAEYYPVRKDVFDDSDRPQTVQVSPEVKVDRDVVVSWDIDRGVQDWREEYEERFSHPRVFQNLPVLCSRIPRGAVITSAAIVLAEDGCWLTDVTRRIQRAARVLELGRKGEITADQPESWPYVDEDVAVVYSEFSRKKTGNYWHWMTEGLTRAAILRRSGAPETVRILIPAPVRPLHTQSLAAIGIAQDRIVEWSGSPTRFRSVYLPTANPRRSYEPVAAPISYIREYATPNGRKPERRLWVSRQLARRRQGFFQGEEKLIEVAEGLGFEQILAENFTVAEQAELFAEAEVIAGVHGAGLTNAVFMLPGTKVAEVAPQGLKPNQKVFYWNLAAATGQSYSVYVTSESAVDTAKVERVLADLLVA